MSQPSSRLVCRLALAAALLPVALSVAAQEGRSPAAPAEAAAAAASAAPASAAPSARRIELVHMGGNDCPPCVLWRGIELPKLQAMPEYKLVQFHYVVKTIKSTVPPAFFFPASARHLQPELARASNGLNGAPHQALLVDGKVVDYWFGTGSGKADAASLAAMIRAVHDGKPLPRATCTQLDTHSTCKKGAEAGAQAKAAAT